ncbi:MAG: hypothetical protein ACK559_21045, partial [bacterium]
MRRSDTSRIGRPAAAEVGVGAFAAAIGPGILPGNARFPRPAGLAQRHVHVALAAGGQHHREERRGRRRQAHAGHRAPHGAHPQVVQARHPPARE